MKLIDELVARAAAADTKANDLAAREEAGRRRRQAYQRLQHLFDQFASDGQLDAKELAQLEASFRANGLTTEQIESLIAQLEGTDAASIEVTGDLRTRIGDVFRDADMSSRDPSLMLEAQSVMSEYQLASNLASRVSKAEHEIYMAAIRNLKA